MTKRTILFQSLIGTVQHRQLLSIFVCFWVRLKFQSLIGTVQQLFLQHFCLYYTLFFPFFNPFPSKKSVDLSFQKVCNPAFFLHSFKIWDMPLRSTDFSGIFWVFLTIFPFKKSRMPWFYWAGDWPTFFVKKSTINCFLCIIHNYNACINAFLFCTAILPHHEQLILKCCALFLSWIILSISCLSNISCCRENPWQH